jgi:hypothetical protein
LVLVASMCRCKAGYRIHDARACHSGPCDVDRATWSFALTGPTRCAEIAVSPNASAPFWALDVVPNDVVHPGLLEGWGC